MTSSDPQAVEIRTGHYEGRPARLVSQSGSRARVRLLDGHEGVVEIPAKLVRSLDVAPLARSFLTVYRSGPGYS